MDINSVKLLPDEDATTNATQLFSHYMKMYIYNFLYLHRSLTLIPLQYCYSTVTYKYVIVNNEYVYTFTKQLYKNKLRQTL